MLKAIIALLVFGATHLVTGLVALLWLNRENLLHEQPMDNSLLLEHPEVNGMVLLIGSLVAIGLLLITKIARISAISSLFQRPQKSYLPALTAVVLLAFGNSFVLAPFELEDNGTTALFNMMKDNVWCLLLLCVIGPILEEIVFRESILRNLAAKTMSAAAAVIVSGILFGAVHANWAQIIPATIIGFIFGVFYLRSGNIQLCGYAHILNNSLAILLMFIPLLEDWMQSLSSSTSFVIGAVFILFGIAMLGVWWKKSSLQMISTDPLEEFLEK